MDQKRKHFVLLAPLLKPWPILSSSNPSLIFVCTLPQHLTLNLFLTPLFHNIKACTFTIIPRMIFLTGYVEGLFKITVQNSFTTQILIISYRISA